ncbi:MAG TPA: rhodanese-like domain-containing protein [Planctomycetaceae bacterium]|nr:rhodanese-like domain-containing protein [Planctomycetaceae bacterium]
MRFAHLLLVVAAPLAVVAHAAEHTKDTLPTVKENVEKGKAVLVDVREKKEWDEGHIAGAVFLPLSAIQDGLSKDELARLPKDKILYVHCVVGKRALTAGNAFEKAGFTVRPIKPGFKELVEAGLPKAKPSQD